MLIFCVFLFVLSSIKLELEKLAQEKTEMQRHYVMVSRWYNNNSCRKCIFWLNIFFIFNSWNSCNLFFLLFLNKSIRYIALLRFAKSTNHFATCIANFNWKEWNSHVMDLFEFVLTLKLHCLLMLVIIRICFTKLGRNVLSTIVWIVIQFTW